MTRDPFSEFVQSKHTHTHTYIHIHIHTSGGIGAPLHNRANTALDAGVFAVAILKGFAYSSTPPKH